MNSDDGHSIQTNFLIAIQSKIYEHNYMRGDFFSKDQFLLSYSKAMLRVMMRVARAEEYTAEQGRQVILDFSLISDLLMDFIDKEEHGIVIGFYHGITTSIKDNCKADISISKDVMAMACAQKRKGTVKFPN